MIFVLGFVINLLVFILFGVDKRKATRGQRRIAEFTLLSMSFLGPVGGLVGMFFFHHKTRKLKFRLLLPLFLFLQLLLGDKFY